VRPAAPLGAVIVDPLLPEWLPELLLENVAVGAGRLTLRVFRDQGGRCGFDVSHNDSGLRVIGPGDADAADAHAFATALP